MEKAEPRGNRLSKVVGFLENAGNVPFITFLLGSFANGFPNLISDNFPRRRNEILLGLYFLGIIATLWLARGSIWRRKALWSGASIALLAFLLWKLPGPSPVVEITYPRQNDRIFFASPGHSEIVMRGKVSDELLSRIQEGALDVYIIKIDQSGRSYLESQEPARIDNKGTWIKSLGFYADQKFSLMAVVASSPELAKEGAAAQKVYLSNAINFETTSSPVAN